MTSAPSEATTTTRPTRTQIVANATLRSAFSDRGSASGRTTATKTPATMDERHAWATSVPHCSVINVSIPSPMMMECAVSAPMLAMMTKKDTMMPTFLPSTIKVSCENESQPSCLPTSTSVAITWLMKYCMKSRMRPPTSHPRRAMMSGMVTMLLPKMTVAMLTAPPRKVLVIPAAAMKWNMRLFSSAHQLPPAFFRPVMARTRSMCDAAER